MEGSNEKPTVGIEPVTVGLLFVWMYIELKVTLKDTLMTEQPFYGCIHPTGCI